MTTYDHRELGRELELFDVMPGDGIRYLTGGAGVDECATVV
jgi:hypothetical protein